MSLIGGNPVDDAEFEQLMHGLRPFEPAPTLAVACSGGADSMALLLLSCAWARNAGGSISALVVDHGLRPDSAAEARRVCGWAEQAGAHPVLLEWNRPASGADGSASSVGGPVSGANLQARARDARYQLMTAWCRDAGVLHLLVGHHQDDQAETLLLRLSRGSGVDGLAAMAPVVERSQMRVLRPLLDIPRTRLAATLAARGGSSVEDPSNHDSRFARVRMRQLLPMLEREGLSPARLAATAAYMARARAALEGRTAAMLADAAAFFPEGYARIDSDVLCAAEPEVVLRALARIVSVIGGRQDPPRLKRVERLYERLQALSAGERFAGRTIGGCRIFPHRKGGSRKDGSGDAELLVTREPAMARQRLALPEQVQELCWDGRFRLQCSGGGDGLEIRQLGAEGWSMLRRSLPAGTELPAPVLHALPAVWSLEGVVEAPHLNGVAGNPAGRYVHSVAFAPESPIGVRRFANSASAHHTDRIGAKCP